MPKKPDDFSAADASRTGAAGASQVSGMAPDLEWLADGVPRAQAFDDTYFSRAGGLLETRHVFLAGNGLPERWQDAKRFTIGELGFGTGLNFLTSLHALRQLPEPPQLTFLSFELFPMSCEQLVRSQSAFPELAEEAEGLQRIWSPAPGWNRFCVLGADLILGIGDARLLMAQARDQLGHEGLVDAWFLDGFSPAKNPELWGEALLAQVQRLTSPAGTLATYTSAGWVRRNLQAAGFEISKQKGFAGKREMVVGRKPALTPSR